MQGRRNRFTFSLCVTPLKMQYCFLRTSQPLSFRLIHHFVSALLGIAEPCHVILKNETKQKKTLEYCLEDVIF